MISTFLHWHPWWFNTSFAEPRFLCIWMAWELYRLHTAQWRAHWRLKHSALKWLCSQPKPSLFCLGSQIQTSANMPDHLDHCHNLVYDDLVAMLRVQSARCVLALQACVVLRVWARGWRWEVQGFRLLVGILTLIQIHRPPWTWKQPKWSWPSSAGPVAWACLVEVQELS